ncbi:uncharacterized protein L969DRAFT_117759 [Mixia osmundae IAM 14324]|uniref:uncharacterized protein n=1 Tax=Mixia osmundae (strain CBS 9802 / IAM 14324 / JCM 22182 / KY 12970) TaxID=764103 RepID=UPI0004A5524D|nr:uncharacterized protein L969DRAFT_117759 [Mixia osmundae IAM 14324]KEI41913.1 hypothetical protein L969DRAFT_117759 [Mixia osmundae IAM 14324]
MHQVCPLQAANRLSSCRLVAASTSVRVPRLVLQRLAPSSKLSSLALPQSLLTVIRDSPAAIRTDWSSEKPLWPLSAYGPTKHAPTLISDVEHSPEEIRLEFYQARAQNAPHLIVR